MSHSVHGGDPAVLLQEDAPPASGLIDFSVDLNPLGPPSLCCDLREGLDHLRLYPEPTYRDLRESAARRERVDPGQIVPGNGTADLIHLITRANLSREAGVVVPTFTEYERAARADRLELRFAFLREEDQFRPEAAADLASLGSAGLLFLCNPNNPTGGIWPADGLQELLGRCARESTTVVVDEAYMEFVRDDLRTSAADWLASFPNLIVLRSLTKILALPGLRLGYLIAGRPLADRLRAIQPPWAVNGLAAWAGKELLEWQGLAEFLTASRRATEIGRSFLEEGLAGLGFQPVPSQANFILSRWNGADRSTADLARALLRQGILVRLCDDFTGLAPGRYLRFAVRGTQEITRLLDALEEEVRPHAG